MPAGTSGQDRGRWWRGVQRGHARVSPWPALHVSTERGHLGHQMACSSRASRVIDVCPRLRVLAQVFIPGVLRECSGNCSARRAPLNLPLSWLDQESRSQNSGYGWQQCMGVQKLKQTA